MRLRMTMEWNHKQIQKHLYSFIYVYFYMQREKHLHNILNSTFRILAIQFWGIYFKNILCQIILYFQETEYI